jgi:UDP-glucuronate 4-epimerase
MAYYLFTKAILGGIPIDIFNHEKMKRDFTYMDDVVEGIIRVIDNKAASNLRWSGDNPNRK